MKENNIPFIERFAEFPWILSDLIFPFMVEYLVCPLHERLRLISLTTGTACVVPHLGNSAQSSR